MKLMYKTDGGFHHFNDGEVDGAIKDGWEDGEPVRAAALAAKRKNNLVTESATVTESTQARRGRPPKAR